MGSLVSTFLSKDVGDPHITSNYFFLISFSLSRISPYIPGWEGDWDQLTSTCTGVFASDTAKDSVLDVFILF